VSFCHAQQSQKRWQELTCGSNPSGYQSGNTFPIRRPAALLVNGKYLTAPLPQYENYDVSQFVSIKGDPDHPVYGDSEFRQPPSPLTTPRTS
jgi:glucan 1,3-beta-glucosidase